MQQSNCCFQVFLDSQRSITRCPIVWNGIVESFLRAREKRTLQSVSCCLVDWESKEVLEPHFKRLKMHSLGTPRRCGLLKVWSFDTLQPLTRCSVGSNSNEVLESTIGGAEALSLEIS